MTFQDRLASFGIHTVGDSRLSVFKATAILSCIAMWCALTASMAMSSESPATLKSVAWSVAQASKEGVTANLYSGIQGAVLEVRDSAAAQKAGLPFDCSDAAADCTAEVIATKSVQWADEDCPVTADGEHCEACQDAAQGTWTAAVAGVITTALSLYTTYSRMYHVDSLDKKVLGITTAMTAFSAMLYSIMRFSNDCYGNPPESLKELAMSFESALGPGWYLMLLGAVCKAFVSLVHLVTPVLEELQSPLAGQLMAEAHRLPTMRKFVSPQAVQARRAAPLYAQKFDAGKAAASVALAGSMAAGIANPAFAAGNAANGEAVFSGNCAACHAGGNNVIQSEKTLKKDALEQYLAGGLKPESIITQVTNGKNAMPAFGGRLGDDEIADVAQYVYDTATGPGWD